MRRRSACTWTGLLLTLMVGCGPNEAEQQAAAVAAREAEVAALRESRGQLEAKRQELAALIGQAAAAAATAADPAAPAPAADAAAPATDWEAQIAAKRSEVDGMSEDFGRKLVEALNADPLIEGEPPSAQQKELVTMKSAEDMILARDYIDQGGDYRGAIQIYNASLAIDPDNQALKDALAKAEADRYMTAERFAQVTKGMTQDAVISLIGRVNSYNVKEYPEKNVVAWFYPREDGSAAGVFFEKNKQGVFIAYQVNFDAVKSNKAEGG